jgi:hypothetical protein
LVCRFSLGRACPCWSATVFVCFYGCAMSVWQGLATLFKICHGNVTLEFNDSATAPSAESISERRNPNFQIKDSIVRACTLDRHTDQLFTVSKFKCSA